jgi:hypothetical protein
MSKAFYILAVSAPFGKGWQAYCHLGLDCDLSVGEPFTTEQEARAAFMQSLREHLLLPRIHPVSRKPQEPLTLDDMEVRWFDPSKNFTHCDNGYIYDENGNTNQFVTFLAYTEDGKAKVSLVEGEVLKEMVVDPHTIKPMKLHGHW